MTRAGSILSGVLGGLIVLVVGAVLIATGVIDTGDDTRQVVRQAPINQGDSADEGEGRTVSDIYREEGSGVVFIESRGVQRESGSPFGDDSQGTATGSGFVVDKGGTIVTNAHVVEGADKVTVRFDEKGEQIDAQVQGRDPSTDLAVLKIDPSKLGSVKPLPLGQSSDVKVGDPTIAIGNPFGLSRTVTTGIVSAKQRQIEAPNGFQISNVIQTDASINPGNSGGPLLDAAGRVIGINSQIATGSGGSGSVGIGFAVPVDTAKKLLPRLRDGERIERGYLGVEMAAVTSSLAEELKLPVKEGALLQTAVPGGPADKAGLRGGSKPNADGLKAGGDLIVGIDGKDVKDPDAVAAAIEAKAPGETVTVDYLRGGEKKSATVTLTKRPAKLAGQAPQQDDNSPSPIP